MFQLKKWLQHEQYLKNLLQSVEESQNASNSHKWEAEKSFENILFRSRKFGSKIRVYYMLWPRVFLFSRLWISGRVDFHIRRCQWMVHNTSTILLLCCFRFNWKCRKDKVGSNQNLSLVGIFNTRNDGEYHWIWVEILSIHLINSRNISL